MRLLLAPILVVSAFGTTNPAAAETVIIDNQRGEKVKLCTYRSDDQSLIRPRKCWMLKRGQKVEWRRGGEAHAYDIRLFEPGAFELPICFRPNISNSYRIEIVARETRACITAQSRTFAQPRTWSDGSRVLVNHPEDNFWYPATVLRPIGNLYQVRFDDRRTETVEPRLMTGFGFDASQKLQVNWKNQGHWYTVRLKSANKDRLRVIYDDGKEENASLAVVRVALPRAD